MHRLQRVAVAGNTAALILLSLVLARGPLFFGAPEEPRPAAGPQRRAPTAQGVLLFVVDGLRRDFAFAPERMPNLARLAREGGAGIARVESLVAALARTRPEQAGTFATGLAGAIAGQATAAAIVFATANAYAAAALGLLVRLAGEVNSVFLGSALVLALGGLRRRAGRSRRPAATGR